MKIETNGNSISIYTPYNLEFIGKIKSIDGRKWDISNKCWTVPVAAIDTVREMIVTVFGESDIMGCKDGVETGKETVKEKYSRLFKLARETGENQLLNSWFTGCNDPDLECDHDWVHKWAMPDGTTMITRDHMC